MNPATSNPDNSWVTDSPDHPTIPAEVVFLLVVLVLTLFFSLAGIPGEQEPVAGEGSAALRRDWMAERQAQQVEPAAQASQGARTATPLESPARDR
jgi:hypothetical protein